MNARRQSAITIAIFAVVLFLASAICSAGMISLITDQEVLVERDTGPLVAPVMFTVATLALLGHLIAQGIRMPNARGSLVGGAFVGGIASYALFLASGATIYSFSRGEPLIGLLFFGANATQPYAIAVGVIAFAVTLAYLVLLAYQDQGLATRPPRWFWENRDDRDRNAPD